jgi:hypothetical protein
MHPFDAIHNSFFYPCLPGHFHYTTFAGGKFAFTAQGDKTSLCANLRVKVLDRGGQIL